MPRPAKPSKGNARPGVSGSGSTGGDRRPPGAVGAGRPAPGAEDTGPGQGRGALSASRGQVSVQNMIRALNRDGSPSKRQRPASREHSSSREEWEDEGGAEGQLTAIGKLIWNFEILMENNREERKRKWFYGMCIDRRA